MKKCCFILLFMWHAAFLFATKQPCNFIQSVQIKKDTMYEGAHGLFIFYRFDMASFDAAFKSDSVLKQAFINLHIQCMRGGEKVHIMPAYEGIGNDEGEFSISVDLSSQIHVFTKGKNFEFIPYAALAIPAGLDTLLFEINAQLYFDSTHQFSQEIETATQKIHKKTQYLFHISIDTVLVDTFDFKGEYWDGGVFCARCVAPDLSLTLSLGRRNVWYKYRSDSYVYYPYGTREDISFVISEGDQVVFLLMDQDLVFHDFIGNFAIKTKAADVGTTHICAQKSGRIKKFSANWSIEKVI